MEKRRIAKGHTNISFQADGFFVQEKVKTGLNHFTNYEVLAEFDFVPKLIENTDQQSTWQWIEGQNLYEPCDQDLVNLAQILLRIHGSKVKLAPFLLGQRINAYRKNYQAKGLKIPIMEKVYRKINLILRNMDKSTPIHGDLWQENIIKTATNKLFIVDWEYSHLGDLHFELAYLIEALRLNEKQEKLFLASYGNYNPEYLYKHKVLVQYITILWLHTYDVLPFSDQEAIAKLTAFYEAGI